MGGGEGGVAVDHVRYGIMTERHDAIQSLSAAWRCGGAKSKVSGTEATTRTSGVLCEGDGAGKNGEVWEAPMRLQRGAIQTPWAVLRMDLQSRRQDGEHTPNG